MLTDKTGSIAVVQSDIYKKKEEEALQKSFTDVIVVLVLRARRQGKKLCE